MHYLSYGFTSRELSRMRPSMIYLIILLSIFVFGEAIAKNDPTQAQSKEKSEPPAQTSNRSAYVSEFYNSDSAKWQESFNKLPLEQQVEIGVAGFGHEPSTARWIEAAVDNGKEEAILILLHRLDGAQSRSTIDPLLLAMDYAVRHMPSSYRLSDKNYSRCEQAATRVPELTRKRRIDEILWHLKARTAP